MIFFDVDTQHDFMDEDGALAVPGAARIRSNIERLLLAAGERGIATVSSRCAHDRDDAEFRIFPPHCIEGTRGAERIFPELPALPRCEIPSDAGAEPRASIEPGTHYLVSKKVFDMFSNAWLDGLRREGFFTGRECVVFGVATDYCVRACGLGLAQAGARVTVVEDAISGVEAGTTLETIEELRANGVEFSRTDDILKKISGTGKN